MFTGSLNQFILMTLIVNLFPINYQKLLLYFSSC